MSYPPKGWEVHKGGIRQIATEVEGPEPSTSADAVHSLKAVEQLIVPPPTNPMAVARAFLTHHYADDTVGYLIRHHRNTFYIYDATSWPELEDRRLQSDLYTWLADAWYWKKTKDDEQLVEFQPTRHKVVDLIDAIRASTHLDGHRTPPTWLAGDEEPEVVPVANGLLVIRTRKLMPHTPAYFSPHVLPFAYDASAPRPARWLQFIEELWEDDVESMDTLAEVMGYILGGGTGQQKIFMLVGPLRSGKGTIGRVLTGLLGAHNVAAPTLAGLTTNFGLSPLIDRPLGLISDARLSTRADGSIAVERLLSISGEDSITVDRKYRDPWTGRLPTRFLILTNEIPRFTDASGALASRFVMSVMTKSFFGEEDPGLTDALLAESPGIFNWCLDGLDRLNARGYFEQPESSCAALVRLQDLASPVGAFVRDRCVIGPAREVGKDDLFAEWKVWCEGEGKDRAGTKAVFFRDLNAAYPGLVESKIRGQEARLRVLRGIGIRGDREWENNRPDPGPSRTTPVLVQGPGPGSASETRSSDGVVQGGPGSSALYIQPGSEPDGTPDHEPPLADPEAPLEGCVRCDRYGANHDSGHIQSWPAMNDGVPS